MLIEGIAGLLAGKRGRSTPGAIGASELSMGGLVQEAGGRYTELAWNGLIYTLSSGLVATPAVGPLAAGGTPILALYNPASSGFLGVILRVFAGWTATGTVSGKAFEIDGAATAAITQSTIQRGGANYIGASDDNDLQGFTAVALTGSTALKRLRWLATVGNAVAQNAVPGGPAEDIGGSILVPPGTVAAITAAVVGTANEAVASLEYAKLRIT